MTSDLYYECIFIFIIFCIFLCNAANTVGMLMSFSTKQSHCSCMLYSMQQFIRLLCREHKRYLLIGLIVTPTLHSSKILFLIHTDVNGGFKSLQLLLKIWPCPLWICPENVRASPQVGYHLVRPVKLYDTFTNKSWRYTIKWIFKGR